VNVEVVTPLPSVSAKYRCRSQGHFVVTRLGYSFFTRSAPPFWGVVVGRRRKHAIPAFIVITGPVEAISVMIIAEHLGPG
jgi:hypothetical protein